MAVSGIAPPTARRNEAASSSIFGQRIPGLSEMAMPLFRVTSCWLFVTAGSSPTLATLRSMSVLMIVDLPTLGMPTIMARTTLPGPVLGGARRLQSSGIRRRASDDWVAESAIASTLPPGDASPGAGCSASRWRSHAFVTAGSARSLLLSTLTHGFWPRSSATTGFSLACGMRASSTSMMTSCDGIDSAIMRRALVMWPGYH
ncbi:hypothetical protein BE08_05360 [Sorangium cellulosum]|uniref:Uncharacterized protein n=1 Tax=Sorangium cellulosum TaxID=56 RepID=A0A150PPS0_SORCE|nr:hypothetical protein BE08_05360 [Sorangium cellulosum]